MVLYFLFIVVKRLFLFSYNGLRKAVSLNRWHSLVFQYFSEFSTWKPPFCSNSIGNCSADGGKSFWFLSLSLPLKLCHMRLWVILLGSSSREKCPCFGIDIHFLLWTLFSSSSCFLSLMPFPILSIAFRVTRVYRSLCQCSIARSDGSGSSLESVWFSQPPSEAAALQCYQIILFQKLLIKTWVIGQVTKDFLFIFLNNGKYQMATIRSSYLVSLFQSHIVGTGFNSARMREDGDLFLSLKNK